MKIKKLIALIMAFAMLLSYSVCAGAQPVSLSDLVNQIAAPGMPAESDAMPDISQLGALMPLLGALGLPKTAEFPDDLDLSSLVPQISETPTQLPTDLSDMFPGTTPMPTDISALFPGTTPMPTDISGLFPGTTPMPTDRTHTAT